MISASDRELRVRRGQGVAALHHNRLVDFAERIQLQRGQLRGLSEPGGFTPRIEAQVVVNVEHPFRVQFGTAEEHDFVTIDAGHVNGIIPQLGGVALDATDESGLAPRLEITKDAWLPYGTGERALVLLRYELDAGFLVAAVTPVALPQPPAVPAARQWLKLCATLYRTGGAVRVRQHVYFDQYFTASAGTTAGRFNAWPRAAG